MRAGGAALPVLGDQGQSPSTIGDTSGGFFADAYPRNVHGASHGRALTFGRFAALHAASQKG
ncbi:MAG: hypothetical protein A2133_03455 [Actinobacteria bacterium RBG_16_64_13]|nr:MAG: hypothetical protein A2133_03455 [Actinobacteria bacterium RBG_16_64_13]